MKLLIDVMGNPAESGGMNLYARELILAWTETFPDDELVVVGGPWASEAFENEPAITTHVVKRSSALHRLWVQTVWSGLLARKNNCDSLLSLSSVGAFTFPRDRVAVVVHDWRHRRRPDEFSLAQRIYRKLWSRSIARAATVVAISPKTGEETLRFSLPRRLEIVPNGNDNARRWKRVGRPVNDGPRVLTYGHFVNKRAETVIEAVAALQRDGDFDRGKLVVVGARREYRDTLIALAENVGVADQVDLPGFVADDVYQALLQKSDVVVLNSSDEGYGLPVSEANYFGIPVIGATDSGLVQIHGHHVVAADPTPVALSHAIKQQLSVGRGAGATRSTWSDCASQIRGSISSAGSARKVSEL